MRRRRSWPFWKLAQVVILALRKRPPPGKLRPKNWMTKHQLSTSNAFLLSNLGDGNKVYLCITFRAFSMPLKTMEMLIDRFRRKIWARSYLAPDRLS